MFTDQYEEHLAHSTPCSSRWAGFDRGDRGFYDDYEDARLQANEELLAEMRAEGLL